jgi:serine/threonine-protein kinase
MTEAEFREAIAELGLVADVQVGDPARRAGDVDRIGSVNPTGNLTEGTTVTGLLWGPLEAPPAPQAVTVSGTPAPGGSVTINWPRYDRCPEDLPLSGYTFSVQNGAPSSGNPVSPGSTSMTIQLPAQGGETVVSYIANCSQQESAPSGATTITTPPPAATNTPAPVDPVDPPADEGGDG